MITIQNTTANITMHTHLTSWHRYLGRDEEAASTNAPTIEIVYREAIYRLGIFRDDWPTIRVQLSRRHSPLWAASGYASVYPIVSRAELFIDHPYQRRCAGRTPREALREYRQLRDEFPESIIPFLVEELL